MLEISHSIIYTLPRMGRGKDILSPDGEPGFSVLSRGITPAHLALSEVGNSGIYEISLHDPAKGRSLIRPYDGAPDSAKARMIGVYPQHSPEGKYPVLGGQRCIIPVIPEGLVLSLGSHNAPYDEPGEQKAFVFSQSGKVLIESFFEGTRAVLPSQTPLVLGRGSGVFESSDVERTRERGLMGMMERHAILGLLPYELVGGDTVVYTDQDARPNVPLVLFEDISSTGSTVFLI
jgi:hypothetical protein